MAHIFDDSAGRIWRVELDAAALARVKNRTPVDLARSFNDGRLFTYLAGDPELLVNVLHAVVEPQAVARGVTPADFGRSLAGGAIDRAARALINAVTDLHAGEAGRRLRDVARRIDRAIARDFGE